MLQKTGYEPRVLIEANGFYLRFYITYYCGYRQCY